VEKLFLDYQFCQNHAEIVQEPIPSHLDACPVQEFGCVETGSSCFASDAPATCTETHQEPSAVLWAQVAAIKYEGHHIDIFEL